MSGKGGSHLFSAKVLNTRVPIDAGNGRVPAAGRNRLVIDGSALRDTLTANRKRGQREERSMKVTQAIAEAMKREGVQHLFAYPINPVIESCAEIGIRPIIVRQ